MARLSWIILLAAAALSADACASEARFDRPEGAFEVYIDGALATAYTRVEADAVIIEPPFTVGAHLIELRAPDGTVLAMKEVVEDGPWDRIERSGDVSMSSTHTIVTQSDDEVTGHSSAQDLRAAGSLLVERGRWTLSANGEVLGADDLNRTPFASHKVDVSQLSLQADYTSEAMAASFTLGDVSLRGAAPLVAGYVGGRGGGVTVNALDQRLELAAGVVSGVNVIGWREGGQAPGADDFRAVASASMDLLGNGPVTATVSASALTARRRVSTGFGVNGLDDAEENTVIGGRTEIAAMDGRLRYSGEIAWSRYSAPFPGFDANESGFAQRHRIEADLLDDKAPLTAWAIFEAADAPFHSIAGGMTSDQRRIGLGVDTSLGAIDLSLSAIRIEDNLDDVAALPSTTTTTIAAELGYSFDSRILGAFTPDSIGVSASRTTHEARDGARYLAATGFGPEALADQTETTMGAAADWSWRFGETGVAYDATFFDDNAVGSAAADTVRHAVYVTQSLRGDGWALEGHLGADRGREKDPAIDGASSALDWGISARLTPEGLPHLSLSYEQGRAKERLRAFDEYSEDSQQLLAASLDFAPVLARAGLDNISATLAYRMSMSSFEDGFSQEGRHDQRVILSLGAKF